LARRIRLFIEDTAQHIILNGISSSVIFREEIDYKIFISFINDIKYLVEYMHIF